MAFKIMQYHTVAFKTMQFYNVQHKKKKTNGMKK